MTWDTMGGGPNVWAETEDTDATKRVPIQLNEGGSSMSRQKITDYIGETYKRDITDPKVFDLPASCSATKRCPAKSICNMIQPGAEFAFLE